MLVSLFDGIGALARAAHLAGLPIEGVVCAECDEAARRVSHHHFPRPLVVDDVAKLDEAFVRDCRRQFARVSLVLVGGGFPCQESAR